MPRFVNIAKDGMPELINVDHIVRIKPGFSHGARDAACTIYLDMTEEVDFEDHQPYRIDVVEIHSMLNVKELIHRLCKELLVI